MAYTRPTLSQIITRVIGDIEASISQRTQPNSKSVFRVLARVFSGAVHLLFGFLDWIALQLFPDTAEGEYLDRWAAVWGMTRKPPDYASGSLTVTGQNGSILAAGKKFQTNTGIEYSVRSDVTISGGTGTASILCLTSGKDGNLAAGEKITLVTPVAGIDNDGTVAAGGITGGTDLEIDDDLRDRLIDRLRFTPSGGNANDYVLWCKEVSGVTRAWCYENWYGGGTVGITFVCDNEADLIPTAKKVQDVSDYLATKRPVCHDVYVFAPSKVTVNFTISNLSPNNQAVKDAIKAKLTELVNDKGVPGGTLYLSQINEAISLAENEVDHTLVAPAANIVVARNEICIMGAITWA